MGSYWFMFIFCVFVVLLAIIVIPWIIISFIFEMIQNRNVKHKKRKKGELRADMIAGLKLVGALMIFAGLAVFLAFESIPYFKDFPHVIKSEYHSEANVIEEVDDRGKSRENKIRMDGKVYYSTKIKRKHEGEFIRFTYLPHTKKIISIEWME